MFTDRADAGRQLGQRLKYLRACETGSGGSSVVVLGLPRGGVQVATEVAAVLGAPLDVIMVRKLGVPAEPELAMGAIGEDGVRVLLRETVQHAGITPAALAEVERRERAELARRAERFRGDRPRVPLAGRTAVVVDDGIATGSTARAACQVVRAQGAAHIVVAVPVAPSGWVGGMRDAADELIALLTPAKLQAIGAWYTDFSQTTDEQVVACLRPPTHSTDSAGLSGPQISQLSSLNARSDVDGTERD